jgi:hypothetical protein
MALGDYCFITFAILTILSGIWNIATYLVESIRHWLIPKPKQRRLRSRVVIKQYLVPRGGAIMIAAEPR